MENSKNNAENTEKRHSHLLVQRALVSRHSIWRYNAALQLVSGGIGMKLPRVCERDRFMCCFGACGGRMMCWDGLHLYAPRA